MERRKAATHLVVEDGWIVGLAEENVGGYNRLNYGPFENDIDAKKLAARINAELGLTEREAMLIVLSSMFPMSDVAHAKRVQGWAKV